MTSTRTRRAPAPAAREPAPKEEPQTDFDAEVVKTAESLIKDCSEVKVRINWFGMSAKVDEEIAQEMLDGAKTNADRKAVSISKRLLSSKHESLVGLKQARKAIEDHIRAWTIPQLALKAVSTEDIGDDGLARKDAGVRLIQKKDIAAFDERLQYLIGILGSAAQTFQRHMPEIKQADKERLGKLYDEHDYPDDVTKLVGAEVHYRNVNLDIDWQTLCPAIYQREANNARVRMETIVENAAVEFAKRFVNLVKQVSDQLGTRRRLNPAGNAPPSKVEGADTELTWRQLREAEVISETTHEHDEDIAEGYVRLELRLMKPEGQKGSSQVVTLAPMSKNHYNTMLRPYETDQKKKVYASTIDNLKQELEVFIHVGDMLGPYKGVISEAVAKVRARLSEGQMNMDSEKIASELRTGKYFREQLNSALQGVAQAVQANMTDASRSRRNIRRVKLD